MKKKNFNLNKASYFWNYNNVPELTQPKEEF